MKPVHLIGVPLDLGGGRRGVDMGPSAFRIAGLGERITRLGYPVIDHGNLPTPIPETQDQDDDRKKYILDIARVCQQVYESALMSFESGGFARAGRRSQPGGGSVAAAAEWAEGRHKTVGLIWIDAHGDEHAGDIAGRQRARHAARGADRPRTRRVVADRRLVAESPAGARGPRASEPRRTREGDVRSSGIRVFTMKDIDRQGSHPSWNSRPLAGDGPDYTCHLIWTRAIPRDSVRGG